MADRKKSSRTSKGRVNVTTSGRAYIQASFNNIIISITNSSGDVLAWSSSGRMRFKGSKKSTPYAAQVAAESCARDAYELGVRTLDVYVKGPGAGREAAIRSLQHAGLEVKNIHDVTPLPHNGCRPPKRRRV